MFFALLFIINLNYFLYLLFLLLLVAFLVLLERKLLGLIQERKGPNIVGVFGILQTVLDGVKLLTKKNYYNYMSSYFLILPIIGMFLSFMHWLVLPFPFEFFKGNFSVLISFVLMGLLVYVVLGCGYVSSSSYGVVGSVRAVAQMISYEVVFMFFIMGFLFLIGGYSWKFIMSYMLVDSGFLKFILFIVWMIISSAELNRTPFDLVEGESELVSGYNVEFSGYNFTLLFLSEYMNIWFMGVLFGVLFSYGSYSFLFFVLSFVSLNVIMRGMLPRYKFVDLINLMWKVFLPCVFIFLVGFMMFTLL
uniref:NADH-ubiquinone oxidoreductase chain 1 n=1 Tax=Botryllus gaiae TaxID=2040467 RepID=A0A6F8Z938_9ASCI|nr:NADH dehydrogenase subunit 1 [Botryllus gaiae]